MSMDKAKMLTEFQEIGDANSVNLQAVNAEQMAIFAESGQKLVCFYRAAIAVLDNKSDLPEDLQAKILGLVQDILKNPNKKMVTERMSVAGEILHITGTEEA